MGLGLSNQSLDPLVERWTCFFLAFKNKVSDAAKELGLKIEFSAPQHNKTAQFKQELGQNKAGQEERNPSNERSNFNPKLG